MAIESDRPSPRTDERGVKRSPSDARTSSEKPGPFAHDGGDEAAIDVRSKRRRLRELARGLDVAAAVDGERRFVGALHDVADVFACRIGRDRACLEVGGQRQLLGETKEALQASLRHRDELGTLGVAGELVEDGHRDAGGRRDVVRHTAKKLGANVERSLVVAALFVLQRGERLRFLVAALGLARPLGRRTKRVFQIDERCSGHMLELSQ